MFERFSMSQTTKEWVNKVNLLSFQLKNFLQISAFVNSARKAKYLDLHTLGQTRLSANQSARTILVTL